MIPRADVAAVIAVLLDHPGTRYRILELTGGPTPLDEAFRAISCSLPRDSPAGPALQCPSADARALGRLVTRVCDDFPVAARHTC